MQENWRESEFAVRLKLGTLLCALSFVVQLSCHEFVEERGRSEEKDELQWNLSRLV